MRNDLEPVPGTHLVHTETELEDELPAADLTRVPALVQESPFRIDGTPCSGEARYSPWGRFRRRRRSHRKAAAANELAQRHATSGPFQRSANSNNHDRMSQGPGCAPLPKSATPGQSRLRWMSYWTFPGCVSTMAAMQLEVNRFQRLPSRMRADGGGTVQFSGSVMTVEM